MCLDLKMAKNLWNSRVNVQKIEARFELGMPKNPYN